MKKVQKGSVVDVDYEGRTADGKLFDTSKEDLAKKENNYFEGREYQPLHVTLGEGLLIKGFENGLIGMEEDEEKTINIEAKDAYGEKRPELIKTFPKNTEKDKDLKEGMVVLVNIEGKQIPATVVEVSDNISLDFNHPLAGKDLTFKIKVLKIEN
ncbi:peptidylprolyl isomerase [Candidatus Woesearchaeota archaeon]|nr:peptidylprolyl isomerase [Candidatus Woesearchaeota archaeon]